MPDRHHQTNNTRVCWQRKTDAEISRMNMDFVSTVLVFAKKAGKAWIVVFWTKRPDNVSPIVQVMEFLTWRLKNVTASMAGLATIVVPNCATWIADLMEGKKQKEKKLSTFLFEMKISKTNTIFVNKQNHGGFLFLFLLFSKKQQRQRS